MSGAAVTTEIAWDTTRTVGVEACGEPVGIGSGVRTSVVALGSTVGAGARVGVSLARPGAVGEVEPLGAAAGAVHAPSTTRARAIVKHTRIAAIMRARSCHK